MKLLLTNIKKYQRKQVIKYEIEINYLRKIRILIKLQNKARYLFINS